ncbi:MAG: hypothetical protein V4508_24410 [Pseudomonadota bacterium]
MKLTLLPLLCLACAAHAAPAPNQLTISGALQHYLAERGDLCVGKFDWPIAVGAQDRDAGSRDALQMPVLEKLGMVVGERDGETTRYALSEAGKKFYIKRREGKADFCAGKIKLKKVVRWTPPDAAGETTVSYTYTIAAAPWTRDSAAQQVFPMVDRVVKGQGSLQLTQRLKWLHRRWVAVL